MRATLVTGWNVARALRLVLGIWAFAGGVQSNDYLLMGVGALFAYQAAMNVGCCGSCAVPEGKPVREEIQYEEVKK